MPRKMNRSQLFTPSLIGKGDMQRSHCDGSITKINRIGERRSALGGRARTQWEVVKTVEKCNAYISSAGTATA